MPLNIIETREPTIYEGLNVFSIAQLERTSRPIFYTQDLLNRKSYICIDYRNIESQSFKINMVNTPSEVVTITETMSLKKYNTPFIKLALLGILGGIYIAMGGYLSLLMGYGIPGLAESSPALGKFLAGAFFPLGLILIILVGGELFTGNTSYLVTGARKGVIPWSYLPYNWVVVYFTNLIGALFFCYFLLHLTGMTASEPWRSSIIHIAEYKVSMPWHVVFLKGIGANWMVCLAVWLGLSSNEMFGRLVGIWLPVMAFVTMGYEHSIANMFYIPMGMMTGADVGIWESISKNFIPSTLGNIVGGALFVGMTYSFLYGEKENKNT